MCYRCITLSQKDQTEKNVSQLCTMQIKTCQIITVVELKACCVLHHSTSRQRFPPLTTFWTPPLPTWQDIIEYMSRCDCLSGQCNWNVFSLWFSWNSGSTISTNFPCACEPHCERCQPCRAVSLNSALPFIPSIKTVLYIYFSIFPMLIDFMLSVFLLQFAFHHLADWVFFLNSLSYCLPVPSRCY